MSHELHALRPLPAAPPLLGDLQAALADALAARGPTYVPRTQHKDGGTPHYVNRLILENSPYLLQHAHNPVNWYPWGAEAFEDARRLGRPVFLSIGYSTCHWCHVMEEESFEDEEIASVMNGGFICIKVDREERPDVDAIYMSAVQALTGSGGWPMSVWLNPDRQPFFGGTYFPPRDGARGARHGFLTLLRELARTYSEETERVVKAAHSLTTAVKQQMQAAVALAPTELSGAQWLDSTVERIKEAFDDVHGGTRRTPKFPSNLPVRLLLRQWRRTGDRDALQMATFTLEKMAAGGIYDQVGGGFHRYSTDERWLVPHFEKMLYDNALLAVAYAEAHQATGRADLARVLREILDYVLREMTSRQGGFYSATDADSEGEEGKFFVWSAAEVRELLGADAGRFMAHYDISAAGNFEGHNIPHVAHPDEGEWAGLADARRILYDVRALRPAPLRDEKILAAWNGLMISALAVGGRVLADARYVQAAGRAADFLLANMRQQDRLVRSYQENRRPAGSVQAGGFLEDQSFVAAGLLDLFEATFDARWLREALAVSEGLQRHFADGMTGGWFMTAHDAEPLIAREKPAYDGAEPSGTSVAILNAFRLGAFTSDDRWRQIGHSGLLSLSGLLAERGVALTEALLAVDFQLALPREVALIWPAGQADQGRVLIDVWRRSFSPGTVVAGGAEGPSLAVVAETVPFVRGKTALGGLPTAYVCHQGRCDLPTCDAEVLRGQLDQPRTAI